jgi:membrane protein implicated in regulation of membrane protease activity
MWILAIGWMYVVTLMAATEPNVVGGIMTFFGVGVLPLSLVLYLGGVRIRRRAPKAPRQDATAPDRNPEN